jgi:hypothetical protein
MNQTLWQRRQQNFMQNPAKHLLNVQYHLAFVSCATAPGVITPNHLATTGADAP